MSSITCGRGGTGDCLASETRLGGERPAGEVSCSRGPAKTRVQCDIRHGTVIALSI